MFAMKILCGFMAVLILRQATAGIVRKPPAFSTPVYSNSYLPAAMQVIFHAVEQLKQLHAEEAPQEVTTTKLSSTTQTMKYQRPQSTTPGATSTTLATATTEKNKEMSTKTAELFSTPSLVTEASSRGSSEVYDDLTEAAQHLETSTASFSVLPDGDHEESPEVNEETAEANYVTPETNHESPEPVQEIQEPNQEIPEKSEEEKYPASESSSIETPEVTAVQDDNVSRQQSTTQASMSEIPDSQKKKKPTVDSVVDEIYGIVKPTSSLLTDGSGTADESKSESGMSIEKMESIEDEEEETRFTLLGEKVAQVPRPSLTGYLRRAKVPPNRTLQQLANLYDALSKDARKQGFARFTGYSDEVLRDLQSSAEGGIGPQLKTLLEKIVERNELTRDDAKMRTREALRDLDNTASALNKELRRLLPLRYA